MAEGPEFEIDGFDRYMGWNGLSHAFSEAVRNTFEFPRPEISDFCKEPTHFSWLLFVFFLYCMRGIADCLSGGSSSRDIAPRDLPPNSHVASVSIGGSLNPCLLFISCASHWLKVLCTWAVIWSTEA